MTPTPHHPLAAWWRLEVHGPAATDVHWVISPEVYAMYGLEPDCGLTGEELIAHGHPDGADELIAGATEALAQGQAFGYRRVLRRPDQDLDVYILGMGEYSDDGTLTSIRGVVLDMAATLHQHIVAQVTAELDDIVGARAHIEQAKGILMGVYGLDADTAFGLLGWYSQRTNVRLRTLAERVAAAASSRPGDLSLADAHLARALLDVDAPSYGVHRVDGEARPVEVSVADREGVPTIRLTGEVDLPGTTTMGSLLKAVLTDLPRPGRPHVLDLSGVDYLGPSAVRAIGRIVAKRHAVNANLRVRAGAARDVVLWAGVPESALA